MESVELLLVGNPNAGKSTLFNLLTGGHAKVGNWHGVTVGVTEGDAFLGGKHVRVYDLPGLYSLQSMSMEEKLSRDFLLSHEGATVLFVCECTSLPRTLPLLYALNRNAILLLTKRRMFEKEGGSLDLEQLASRLQIPVLFAEGKGKRALEGELLAALPHAGCARHALLSDIYRPIRPSLGRADALFTKGAVCIPLFFGLFLLTFFLTFAPSLIGDRMKGAISWFFGEYLGGFAEKIPSPVASRLLKEGILQSMGSVLCFLPQIAMLYLFLILTEESGLLSRLAYHTDGFFSAVGLNGRAIFSLLMGFGCTAAAILTTRGLDDKPMQSRTIRSLCYIPCSAKLPVFLTLLSSVFPDPFPAAVGLYLLGTGIALLSARLTRGEKPLFLMELAPLQLPSPKFALKSLLFQIKQFIIKTATVILAFLLLTWLLSAFDAHFQLCSLEESLLAKACGWLKWVFAPVNMGDWRIAYAALSGLVAKENVAGAIAMFYGKFPYGTPSAIAFSVFLLTCSPCVSAIAATAKEIGWRKACLYAAMQTASALLLCYAVYALLTGGWMQLFFSLLPAVCYFLVRKNVERIHRKRRNHPAHIHG